MTRLEVVKLLRILDSDARSESSQMLPPSTSTPTTSSSTRGHSMSGSIPHLSAQPPEQQDAVYATSEHQHPRYYVPPQIPVHGQFLALNSDASSSLQAIRHNFTIAGREPDCGRISHEIYVRDPAYSYANVQTGPIQGFSPTWYAQEMPISSEMSLTNLVPSVNEPNTVPTVGPSHIGTSTGHDNQASNPSSVFVNAADDGNKHSYHMRYAMTFNGVHGGDNFHQVQSCNLPLSSPGNNIPSTMIPHNHGFWTDNLAMGMNVRVAQNYMMSTDAPPFDDLEQSQAQAPGGSHPTHTENILVYGYVAGEGHAGHSHSTITELQHSDVTNYYSMSGVHYEGSLAISPQTNKSEPDNSVATNIGTTDVSGNVIGRRPDEKNVPKPMGRSDAGLSPFSTASLKISSGSIPPIMPAKAKKGKRKAVEVTKADEGAGVLQNNTPFISRKRNPRYRLKIPRKELLRVVFDLRSLPAPSKSVPDIVKYIGMGFNFKQCKLCGVVSEKLAYHWVKVHAYADLVSQWQLRLAKSTAMRAINSKWQFDILIAAAYLCPIPQCEESVVPSPSAYATAESFHDHIGLHIRRSIHLAKNPPRHKGHVVWEEDDKAITYQAEKYVKEHPFWQEEDYHIFPSREHKLVWLLHQANPLPE
ncbi:hypothetical protein BU17DRAFT_68393 [Hysterangium stoloniferum]|nr:hypothetical protein BU17DRAFT_68393 [Hysterangium stoloniferum]